MRRLKTVTAPSWDPFGATSIVSDDLDTRQGTSSIDGSTHVFTKDDNQRRISATELSSIEYNALGGINEDDRYRYERDAFNRIVQVQNKSAQVWADLRYVYDAMGRRVKRTVLDATGAVLSEDRLTYAGLQLIENGNDEIVYGSDINKPLALRKASSGLVYQTILDERGSVMALVQNGTMKMRMRYSVWGQRQVEDLDTSDDLVNAPFGFTGMNVENALSMVVSANEAGFIDRPYYHCHYRDYDSFTGQFDQPDQAGMPDGMNRYVAYFVLGSGGRGFDPDGLNRKDHHAITIATQNHFGFNQELMDILDEDALKIPAGIPRDMPRHTYNRAHILYNERNLNIAENYINLFKKLGINVSTLSGADAREFAEGLFEQIKADPYSRAFNDAVASGGDSKSLNSMMKNFVKENPLPKGGVSTDALHKIANRNNGITKRVLRKLGPLAAIGFILIDTVHADVNTAIKNSVDSAIFKNEIHGVYNYVMLPANTWRDQFFIKGDEKRLLQKNAWEGISGNPINNHALDMLLKRHSGR